MINDNTGITYTIGQYISKTIWSALAILAPLKAYMCVTIFFIIVDMYYGIRVALHQREINNFQDVLDAIDYHKLLKTASKLGDYALLMSGTFIFDTYVLKDSSLYLTSVFTGIVCGSQFWSILKNLITLKPNGPWGIFKRFFTTKASQVLNMDESVIEDNLKEVETDVTKSSKKVHKCN